MLWHWRAREGNNPLFESVDAPKIILSIFGQDYEAVAKEINYYADTVQDFNVNSKSYSSLSEDDMKKIAVISFWRHYAFKWMTSDEEWDQVDITIDTMDL